MKTVAIIPARGGSKGIKYKNLQPVGGVSILGRAILALEESKQVDAVFVSTDDDAIATEALRWGAKVIERPDAIAGDTASSESALLHALEELHRSGVQPELLVFVQATSPFTHASDIDAAIERLHDEGADVTFAVREDHGFQWDLTDEGVATPVGHPSDHRPRRQDLKGRVVETGAFYVMRAAGFRQSKYRFFGKVLGHVVAPARSMEIDDPADLEYARFLAPSLDRESARSVMPEIRAVVFDFDGVMTDDAAYVDQNGKESVRVSRRDGMGIELLRKAGMPMLVLSKEKNPVVARRCEKLRLECIHGCDDKLPTLTKWAEDKGLRLEQVAYVGNDINDTACLEAVGWGFAPADADPRAKAAANEVLECRGGNGAVRELAMRLLATLARPESPNSP